jgi:hypothetical protein
MAVGGRATGRAVAVGRRVDAGVRVGVRVGSLVGSVVGDANGVGGRAGFAGVPGVLCCWGVIVGGLNSSSVGVGDAPPGAGYGLD